MTTRTPLRNASTGRLQVDEVQARLAAIVESSDDAMIGKTLDGVITSWNRAAEGMFGYTGAEAVGKHITLVIPDERRAEEDEVLARLRRGEKVDHFETERQAKDGRRISMSLAVSPVRNALGQIIGTSTVARDITERKRAEAALRESEARLRALVEASPLGIVGMDLDGNPVFYNGKCEELHGIGFDEAKGTGWAQAVHPDDRDRVAASWYAAAKARREWAETYRFVHRDGRVVWVSGRAAPMTIGEQALGFVGTLEDITELKRAEAALRESEEQFRTLADNIAQFAWMADEQGWIFWYNRRWLEYTGTTLEEMQGWGWQKVHHPEHVGRVVEKIRHAFSAGKEWEDTFPLRGRDGQYRWFLSRALPIKDADGDVLRWFGTNTDVTEQLEAAAERERLLERERSAREHVSRILESITDAFFAVNQEWRFTYVNREAERLLQRARDELLGRSLWAEFPEAVGSKFEGHYRRAMADQETVHFEEHYAPLGIWVDVRAFPAAEGLSVYFRDVTARKLAEEALRESEARFRALAENATAAIFVIDEASTIQFANPAVERIFGYAISEMLGRRLDMLIPEDQRALHNAGMQRYLETGRRKLRWEGVELPGLTKDGRVIPLEISMGEFLRDGRHYFTGIARDITERKRAEEARRESEERYRLLADMIPQHIWTTEADGYHSYFSRRWYEYTGATPEQTQGEGWLALLHPADRQRTIARWQQSLRTGEPYVIEYRFRGADDTYRWFLGQAMPLRDEAGEIMRWFGTLTDISERKRLEEERERLLSKEQKARGEAEHAIRLRDELLAIVAHDLRNAVHTVGLGASSMIAPLAEDERLRRLEIIKRAAKGMERLISDLLDVAQIEFGTLHIEPEPLDLRTLLDEALQLFGPQARAREITLTCEPVPDLGTVSADRGRLGQVLSNLLGNAIKFTPQHGRVVLRARPLDGEVRVSVEDSGPGIAAESLPHVFDRFWRADRKSRSGTGLGLAIAKSIVEAHGGRIWVESTPGRGSTFHFTVPVSG